jgi:putative transposase
LILNRLTAKITHGVWLWSKLFEQYNLKGSYGDRNMFSEQIKKESNLPSDMIQCCFDSASWMWRGYREQLKDWNWELKRAKGEWRKKLLKRKPQKPFSKGMNGKVPIWFDYRIGSIERSRIKLCSYVARASTLRKGVKITIPLNSARCHLNLLQKGEIKSFQIVKKDEKFLVHVKVEYAVPDQPVNTVRGVDLGVKRSVASVMLRPNQLLRSTDFTIIRDGLKRGRLNCLTQRVAALQQAKKWELLKRIQHKRKHVAEYFDRLSAKNIADTSSECLVAIGYPKWIKHDNHKGNGKPSLRKKLARWSYGRIIRYTKEECAEKGIPVEAPEEYWSSMTCHKCGARDTKTNLKTVERIGQSLFHCWNCELLFNADFNAAINIGSRFLAAPLTRQGAVDSPYAGDEQAREIVACKLRSPHPFMGGSKSLDL